MQVPIFLVLSIITGVTSGIAIYWLSNNVTGSQIAALAISFFCLFISYCFLELFRVIKKTKEIKKNEKNVQ